MEISKCCLGYINADNTCDECGEDCKHIENMDFEDEVELTKNSGLICTNLLDLINQVQDDVESWGEYGNEELSFSLIGKFIQIKNENDYNIYVDYVVFNEEYDSIREGLSKILLKK